MLNSLLGEQVEQVYDCPAGMPSIYADRGSIEQVLINLAVNARDAMPHGGTLRIGISHVVWSKTDAEANPAREPGEYVCLTVTDNGTGMPREVAERIFEPFYTTKEVGKGTGVGLAIIHGVVRQHCGRIEVETKRGRGTTFRIYLPACDLPPCDNVKKSGKIEKEFAHGTERILVVEDEPALRELVEAILKEAGYHVLVAPDGPNALKIWAEKRDDIDLLITDMVLPSGMLGSAIAAKFREERPDLRLMFTSGYSPDHAGQIIDPAIPFLQKPYQPAELLRLAREALQGLSVKRSG
jgi:CheY-like chemotaxis protein